MSETYLTLSALFTDIANAIREKTGETDSIIADDFPDMIRERLKKKSTIISFKISDTLNGWTWVIEYAEGMTWREWVNDNRFSKLATNSGVKLRITEWNGRDVICVYGSDESCYWDYLTDKNNLPIDVDSVIDKSFDYRFYQD